MSVPSRSGACDRAGFSLIEILVALTIFTVSIAAVLALFNFAAVRRAGVERRLEAERQLESLLSDIELNFADYRDEDDDGFPDRFAAASTWQKQQKAAPAGFPAMRHLALIHYEVLEWPDTPRAQAEVLVSVALAPERSARRFARGDSLDLAGWHRQTLAAWQTGDQSDPNAPLAMAFKVLLVDPQAP